MKSFWDRFVPTIWTRLFLLILMTILLTWFVVAIAFHWLGNARLVVSDMGTVQVPRLTQTSRLSAKAADLAMLSNRILVVDQHNARSLETALRNSVTELIEFIDNGFDTSLSQNDLEDLQQQLALVIQTLNHAQQIENRIRAKVEQLRWLNVDTQDETAALVADFNYNMEVLTRGLIIEVDAKNRREMAETLSTEQSLQSTFADLGNEMSIATTLGVQISTSQTTEQLGQFEDLVSDALARINDRIGILPDKAEYLSLRQGVEALGQLISGHDGLVNERQAWHMARIQLGEQLDTIFALLTDIQSQLQEQAQLQRSELAETSVAFSESSTLTMRLLLVMTVVAALGGLAVLFLYIRPSIIHPMQSLTSAMREIAIGGNPSLAGLPVRNDEIAHLAKAVEAFQDSVHERDQAIQDLRQTQSELVQAGKLAALGNLSAGISHELNQPLGAIRQRLHLIQKAIDSNDNAKLQAQAGKIDDLVLRMERIITHLRRFARRAEYRRERVALVPTIQSAIELLKSQITDCSVSVQIDAELENKTVMGDAVLLEQVLVNLLANACDAIEETGKPGEITIRFEETISGQHAFSVVDTGIGLGEMDPERAFDPFVTTKDPGEGLGLGLSISFNIIRGMDGNLLLARREGTGTRATVSLPSGGT